MPAPAVPRSSPCSSAGAPAPAAQKRSARDENVPPADAPNSPAPDASKRRRHGSGSPKKSGSDSTLSTGLLALRAGGGGAGAVLGEPEGAESSRPAALAAVGEADDATLDKLPEGADGDTSQSKSMRPRPAVNEKKILEQAFAKDKFPNAKTRKELATECNMSPRQVQVWFQNKRQRSSNATKPLVGVAADAKSDPAIQEPAYDQAAELRRRAELFTPQQQQHVYGFQPVAADPAEEQRRGAILPQRSQQNQMRPSMAGPQVAAQQLLWGGNPTDEWRAAIFHGNQPRSQPNLAWPSMLNAEDFEKWWPKGQYSGSAAAAAASSDADETCADAAWSRKVLFQLLTCVPNSMDTLPKALYDSMSPAKQEKWVAARDWLKEARLGELKVYAESSREATLDVARHLVGARVCTSCSGTDRVGSITVVNEGDTTLQVESEEGQVELISVQVALDGLIGDVPAALAASSSVGAAAPAAASAGASPVSEGIALCAKLFRKLVAMVLITMNETLALAGVPLLGALMQIELYDRDLPDVCSAQKFLNRVKFLSEKAGLKVGDMFFVVQHARGKRFSIQLNGSGFELLLRGGRGFDDILSHMSELASDFKFWMEEYQTNPIEPKTFKMSVCAEDSALRLKPVRKLWKFVEVGTDGHLSFMSETMPAIKAAAEALPGPNFCRRLSLCKTSAGHSTQKAYLSKCAHQSKGAGKPGTFARKRAELNTFHLPQAPHGSRFADMTVPAPRGASGLMVHGYTALAVVGKRYAGGAVPARRRRAPRPEVQEKTPARRRLAPRPEVEEAATEEKDTDAVEGGSEEEDEWDFDDDGLEPEEEEDWYVDDDSDVDSDDDDYDDDDDDDREALPWALPEGFAISEEPTQEMLMPGSDEARSLVGRMVLFNWDGVGWCAGLVEKANNISRRTLDDELDDEKVDRAGRSMTKVDHAGRSMVNFYVRYDLDGDLSSHVLRVDNYAPNGPRNSWVLLEELEAEQADVEAQASPFGAASSTAPLGSFSPPQRWRIRCGFSGYRIRSWPVFTAEVLRIASDGDECIVTALVPGPTTVAVTVAAIPWLRVELPGMRSGYSVLRSDDHSEHWWRVDGTM